MNTQRRRGNPNWIKGVSGNPNGRPRGQTSAWAALQNPDYFFIAKHPRWHTFCLEVGLTLNWTEAARRARYSPKSARSTAWRLRRHPAVQVLLHRIGQTLNDPKIYREYKQRIAEGKYGLWW
jgi:hypothetical protein